MKYMVDIDGTVCTSANGDYHSAVPFVDRIEHFNRLFDAGHEVHYWTARGGNTGIDWTALTTQQFADWQVKYTSLSMHKPTYDIWIDDKAINVENYFLEKAVSSVT
jgi:hypothetical protein